MLKRIFENGKKLKEMVHNEMMEITSDRKKVLLSPSITRKFNFFNCFNEFNNLVDDIENTITLFNFTSRQELFEDQLYGFICCPIDDPIIVSGKKIIFSSKKDIYYDISSLEEVLNEGLQIGYATLGGEIEASIEIDGTIVVKSITIEDYRDSEIIRKFQVPLDQVDDHTFFKRVKNLIKGDEF